MAYENMTYEKILSQLMDRVTTDYPNIDVREGSLIYNALSPAAIELATAYYELNNVLCESFVSTATRHYLLLACKQMGIDISKFSATNGTFKGEFDVEVPIDSRWNCDVHNYMIQKSLGKNEETGYYEYSMLCETLGKSANDVTGSLSAITYLPSALTHAELTECLIEGEDERTDSEIRRIYYNTVASTESDGNLAQYEQWCEGYVGIGRHKIFPLWNGNNTVKISILSASNGIATEELIKEFQTYLDPNATGTGDGVAPIGAVVTVTTATPKAINVSATVKFKEGYSDTSVLSTALDQYLSELAYSKQNVPYLSVGATLLASEGVESITNLTINGGTNDVALGNEEIPTIGTTNWVVE